MNTIRDLVAKRLAYGDRLQLKVAAAQQGCYANELARREVLGCEVGLVGGVKFVEKREVRAGDLDVDKIIHGHAACGERGFHTIQKHANFLVHIGWGLASLWVDANATRKVERAAGENGVAEGELRIAAWQMHRRALRRSEGL